MRGSAGGRNFVDLVGQTFGRLTVISREKTYINNVKRSVFRCRCSCGNEKILLGNRLRSGQTTSCGCYASELLSARSWAGYEEISGVTIGRLKSDAKKRNMKWEVTNKELWDLFISQDRKCAISGRPIRFERNVKKLKLLQTASLDRIDSNGHYTIDNIQWIHKDFNILKWDWTMDELYDMCKEVLDNKENYLSKRVALDKSTRCDKM